MNRTKAFKVAACWRWSRIGLIGIFATSLLAGCVVTSVYPYYKEKELRFDPALVGGWREAGRTNTNRETWTFDKRDHQTYTLIVTQGEKKTEFDAHLFKLGSELLLDCLPRERPRLRHASAYSHAIGQA